MPAGAWLPELLHGFVLDNGWFSRTIRTMCVGVVIEVAGACTDGIAKKGRASVRNRRNGLRGTGRVIDEEGTRCVGGFKPQ